MRNDGADVGVKKRTDGDDVGMRVGNNDGADVGEDEKQWY